MVELPAYNFLHWIPCWCLWHQKEHEKTQSTYKFTRYDSIIKLLNWQLKLAYLKLVWLQKAPSLSTTIRHANTIVTAPSTFGSGSFGNDARLAAATDSNSYFHYMTWMHNKYITESNISCWCKIQSNQALTKSAEKITCFLVETILCTDINQPLHVLHNLHESQ
jgi:hypothetical protein